MSCFKAGFPSLLTTTSSPNKTANGSSPMNDLAQSTACPNPFWFLLSDIVDIGHICYILDHFTFVLDFPDSFSLSSSS